jgi:uncharacterized protein
MFIPARDLPYDQIRAFCVEHRIRKLMLFGSILRSDFQPASDIDMLAEFETGATVTLFDLVEMRDQMGLIVGREVDFLTPGFLSPHFRQLVLDTAQTLYESN